MVCDGEVVDEVSGVLIGVGCKLVGLSGALGESMEQVGQEKDVGGFDFGGTVGLGGGGVFVVGTKSS
ncbi:hypothetical protein Hanom_Chr15g01351651 [Helianthus anomalus]